MTTLVPSHVCIRVWDAGRVPGCNTKTSTGLRNAYQRVRGTHDLIFFPKLSSGPPPGNVFPTFYPPPLLPALISHHILFVMDLESPRP